LLVGLEQLCSNEMFHWAKKYVTLMGPHIGQFSIAGRTLNKLTYLFSAN